MNHSGIRDSGARLQIVPSTRKIAVPSANRVIGIVGDCNSEELTIQCPKIIDGHDIEGCASHYVTWKNANGEIGHDHLEILKVDNETETIYFAWLIRGETTTTAGIVSFSIHFEDINANGRPIYRWSTTECSECEVLDCVNALVGAYESIYVTEDTLYIADHTPVRDETLMLQTKGIIPSGTLNITTNGSYVVNEFALVNVAVPSGRTPTIRIEDGMVIADDGTPQNAATLQLDAPKIAVTEGGKITASANALETTYQLSAADDPNFIAENIAPNKTMFGVTGTYKGKTTKVTLTNTLGWGVAELRVLYQNIDGDGYLATETIEVGTETVEFSVLDGSVIFFIPPTEKEFNVTIEEELFTVLYTASVLGGTSYLVSLPIKQEELTINTSVM